MVSDEPDPPAVGGPAIRIARAWLKSRAASVRGCGREHLRAGGEGAGAPRDDLDGAAHALERVGVAVGGSLDLDAIRAHDAPPREPPAIGERERGAASHHRLERFGAGHGEAAVEAEARAHGADLLGVEHAPDEGLARVGGEPAHPHVLGRQPVPDGEQQAGGEPEARVAMGGERSDLLLPEHAPPGLVGPAPVRGVELGARHGLAHRGPDEADALLHPAVVEHARRRRQQRRRRASSGR